MADIVPITEEERELIKPHFKESLDPDSWDMIDGLLDYGVVHTYPDGVHFISVRVPGFAAMQFAADTGEFAELTDWDYILTVDTEAQLEELEEQERLIQIETALRHYHNVDYQVMTDYQKVISNRGTLTVNNTTVYKYECPLQTIYLKEDNYPITIDRQRVDSDYYYYNFGPDVVESDDVPEYTYKVRYEWKRLEDIWH